MNINIEEDTNNGIFKYLWHSARVWFWYEQNYQLYLYQMIESSY